MPWSALEPSVPAHEDAAALVSSSHGSILIPVPRELLDAWSWSCPPLLWSLESNVLPAPEPAEPSFSWLLDTCSLWSSTTKFVFSFPSPNICYQFPEKPTMSKPLRPPPAGSSLSADCCPERDIPSSCSAKQGQSPRDLRAPSDLPGASSPKLFCPFTTDEIASGSGKQWQGPDSHLETSCCTQNGQFRLSLEKPRKTFRRFSKSVMRM